MSRCYLTPLTLKVCGTSSVTWSNFVRNMNQIEQPPSELLTILQIYAHVISRCDLGLWPLDLELLQHFGCHVFKLCKKIERNRITHGWVIDDLARFRRGILGVGHFYRKLRSGAWTQFHQTCWRHRAIIAALQAYFTVPIPCCIFINGQLYLSDVANDAKFRTFWLPVKN